MRTFALALTTAAATAMSGEFIRGCETGIFIMSDEQMNDYSCSEVEISREVKGYMDMVMPMKMMMQNMNQGKSHPFLEFIEKGTQQIGKIYSLFSDEYDGGDFCQGLIFSHEAGQLILTVGRSMFSGMFAQGGDGAAAGGDNPLLSQLLQ